MQKCAKYAVYAQFVEYADFANITYPTFQTEPTKPKQSMCRPVVPLVMFQLRSYRKSLWVIMKGSEFHKEMGTGEVQGRNIFRKGGHARFQLGKKGDYVQNFISYVSKLTQYLKLKLCSILNQGSSSHNFSVKNSQAGSNLTKRRVFFSLGVSGNG